MKNLLFGTLVLAVLLSGCLPSGTTASEIDPNLTPDEVVMAVFTAFQERDEEAVEMYVSEAGKENMKNLYAAGTAYGYLEAQFGLVRKASEYSAKVVEQSEEGAVVMLEAKIKYTKPAQECLIDQRYVLNKTEDGWRLYSIGSTGIKDCKDMD